MNGNTPNATLLPRFAPMLIGYARVSKNNGDQGTAAQAKALKAADRKKIFEKKLPVFVEERGAAHGS